MNYYNEYDPFAAGWLKMLIAAGELPPAIVDARPIQEVTPDDIRGFTQCHFFAGIGGWSLALQIAGWAADEPVWTGSCPCQPFSVAGKGLGTADERHLWPEFRRLIADCNPPVVFGEQVASADGRKWLTGVRADLETLGYGVGAADLCAAGVSAPHIRQRLYWVADASDGNRWGGECGTQEGTWQNEERWRGFAECGSSGWVGNAICEGQEGLLRPSNMELRGGTGQIRPITEAGVHSWGGYWIPCADGKARRIEPGLAPLVDGLPGRVGLIRGYNNAICPQVAAQFIGAYL